LPAHRGKQGVVVTIRHRASSHPHGRCTVDASNGVSDDKTVKTELERYDRGNRGARADRGSHVRTRERPTVIDAMARALDRAHGPPLP